MGADSYTTEGLFDEYENRIREFEEEVRRLKDIARETLWQWAWWHDGIQYVGSGVTTYETALKGLEKQIATEALKEGEDERAVTEPDSD